MEIHREGDEALWGIRERDYEAKLLLRFLPLTSDPERGSEYSKEELIRLYSYIAKN